MVMSRTDAVPNVCAPQNLPARQVNPIERYVYMTTLPYRMEPRGIKEQRIAQRPRDPQPDRQSILANFGVFV